MQNNKSLLVLILILLLCDELLAGDFYLDSPRNEGILRVEIDNDVVWGSDSGFTNGWSIQYHTVSYREWDNAKTLGFVKWVGKHFPTLDDKDCIVRNSHGIGQNMITPGDIEAEIPQEGDLPYAGSLTYSLSWQSFNRKKASNLQLTVGILGEESLAAQFQKFAHNNLGLGTEPEGWDTQRDAEPILNIGYQYAWCLANLGEYQNDWAGQLTLAPSASLGNLFTAGISSQHFVLDGTCPKALILIQRRQGVDFFSLPTFPNHHQRPPTPLKLSLVLAEPDCFIR